MTAAVRTRRRVSPTVALMGALLVLGALYALVAPSSDAADEPSGVSEEASLVVEEGRRLFEVGCSSCHGLGLEGGSDGPSLIGVGAAAVEFQVGTGRMPLASQGVQAERKPPKYTQEEIDQLGAYVQAVGGGPPVPDVSGWEEGDLALGKELFQNNCAQCHNFAGSGGALTFGKYAPNLSEATPVQVATALRTGPESMPTYGPGQIDDDELLAITNYVLTVQDEANPGGAGIGRVGPVSEGAVIWIVGIGALLGVVLWVGARA